MGCNGFVEQVIYAVVASVRAAISLLSGSLRSLTRTRNIKLFTLYYNYEIYAYTRITCDRLFKDYQIASF